MVRDVVIAGGGIGGLTLAVAVRRRGIRVRVVERAPALTAAGAGLVLQPNATTHLTRLDLADAVVAAGHVLDRAAILDDAGRPLGAESLLADLYAGVAGPTVGIHRHRLQDVLVAAAGHECLATGTAVVGYAQHGDHVTVRCDDGAELDTELLVGADGLRSAVRAQMIGAGDPIYAGYTSWRGVTPAGALPPPQRMTESWGRGERFGIVDIGHGQQYWFAVADAPAGGRDVDVHAELLQRFGRWHAPIRQVVEATPADRILRTDIADRDPITRWHEGRVVLIGDAAHPMTPNLGQGAGQAIEDACVLSEALTAADRDVEVALVAYARRRVPRANAIVLASRRVGRMAQWRHPAAVAVRSLLMRCTPTSVKVAKARTLMIEG